MNKNQYKKLLNQSFKKTKNALSYEDMAHDAYIMALEYCIENNLPQSKVDAFFNNALFYISNNFIRRNKFERKIFVRPARGSVSDGSYVSAKELKNALYCDQHSEGYLFVKEVANAIFKKKGKKFMDVLLAEYDAYGVVGASPIQDLGNKRANHGVMVRKCREIVKELI